MYKITIKLLTGINESCCWYTVDTHTYVATDSWSDCITVIATDTVLIVYMD